jgi:ABC-type transport system involved in multi-copper enzyme maturation permease subunit
MKKGPFYAFFNLELKMAKSQIVAFSFLSVIIVILTGLLSIKALFSSTDFFESVGLVIWLMIGIAATNIAAGIGVMDFNKRTGLLVLPQPVDRKLIFLSRLSAAFLILILPITVLYISGFGMSLLLYKTGIPNIFLSYGLAVLYAISFTAMVSGISSMSKEKSTPISFGLTFAFLAVFVFAIFGKFIEIQPWFFLPYGGLAISSVMAAPYLMHINPGNYFFYYIPYVNEAVIIMLAYLAVFAVIGIFYYSKREL